MATPEMPPPPLEGRDLAMLLEALTKTPDPLTRFIETLSDEPLGLKTFAKETVQLRAELIEHVNRVLTEPDPHVSLSHADWIARHVHEIACRWSGLMRSVTHWTRFEAGSLSVRIERTST